MRAGVMRPERGNAAGVALVAASSLLLLATCTESDTPKGDDDTGGSSPTTTTSGGAGGAGGQSTGGSGGQAPSCNALTNDGPEVEIVQVAQSMPAPEGGKIEPGAYHLTAVTRYTGPGGATGPTGGRQRERAQYSTGTVQVVVDLFQGDGDQHFTLSFSADESGTIMYQGTCPGPLNFSYDGFTFTSPDTIRLFSEAWQQELTYRLAVE